MTSFFGKLKSGTGATSPATGSSPSKKDPNAPVPTPLERMLMNAGPIRNDGSDKFFGMENFGNTCYCNSILQCLYYSVPFRENVLNYPQMSSLDTITAAAKTAPVRPPYNPPPPAAPKKPLVTPGTARNPAAQQQQTKPEDKDSPEYKKKQALIAGPILNMGYQNTAAYNMPESLFTALKDIFEAVVTNHQRNGIISPTKFLEVLRKENEMFRSAMHQDAHEFLNLLLNAVVENIEAQEKKTADIKEREQAPKSPNGEVVKPEQTNVSFPSILTIPSNTKTSWLNQLFEGTLTSETRCLTCENTSQRDEAFLDLSVDLEQHSSVTACLRRFSEEEMLCERNKFHCDNCGGLQEAEKRMKIKRLPKILALHLKRFKYTEDQQRLQKLFHKVVYPYHLRLFNTTDDAEDPDRLYELYAVVVHIGGGPYHGHYVAIIKTQDRGWLLFDDEMVEPVDKSYVRNFFGDRPGLACAYVLFYQETTLEAVQKEQRMEGRRRASHEAQVGLGLKESDQAEMHRVRSSPIVPVDEIFTSLDHAVTAPPVSANGHIEMPQPLTSSAMRPTSPVVQSKKEKAREEKERNAGEKEKRWGLVTKLTDTQKRQDSDPKTPSDTLRSPRTDEERKFMGTVHDREKENTQPNGGSPSGMDRFRRSKSLRFGSLTKKDKSEKPSLPIVTSPTVEAASSTSAITEDSQPADPAKEKEKRNRFSIRKKSFNVLQ